MPEIGQLLAGKYRLVRRIGEGGMGQVYEARAAAAVGHRVIVDVYDFESGEDGSFLIMEHLEGHSLSALMKGLGRIRIDVAAFVSAQVLSALYAAHEAGIVHRDLKPANVFLSDGGQTYPEVKLLDFGVSKISDPSKPDDALTATGVVVGTPRYMSPEQARGESDLDHRVDIYSMGVILYESLTGRPPFKAKNALALIQAIVNERPTPPRELRPAIPPELEGVIERALEPGKTRRFPTALAMMEAVLPFVPEAARAQLVLPDPLRSSASSATPPVDPDGPDAIEAQATVADIPSALSVTALATDSDRAPTIDWSAFGAPEDGPHTFSLEGSAVETTPEIPVRSDTDLAWPDSSPATAAARRRLYAGIAVGAVLLLLGGGAAFLAFGPRGEGDRTVPVAVGTSHGGASSTTDGEDAEPSPEEAPSPAAEQLVTITLEGVPEGASVTVDGAVVEGTELRLPRSEVSRVLLVELEGHAPFRYMISMLEDRTVAVTLRPNLPSRPPRGATKRPPSGKASPGTGPRPRDVFDTVFE